MADVAQSIATWRSRPMRKHWDGRRNAMSVDVEDYFQVEALAPRIPRSEWEHMPRRIERNVMRILDLFERRGARGTFFTLGWIGERHPALVREIVARGHELASHGYAHIRADQQSRAEFREDVVRAKHVLEDISGVAVAGYRAPCFSLMPDNLWLFEELARAGYRYSSSTHPIAHDQYGFAGLPRFAFHPLASDRFVEIPVTTWRRGKRNWPCGCGGYFRLTPYALARAALAEVQQREGEPCLFYFHPWEIDAAQPRVRGLKLRSRVRHYLNLSRMEPRLDRLLEDFAWDRIDAVFFEAAMPAQRERAA